MVMILTRFWFPHKTPMPPANSVWGERTAAIPRGADLVVHEGDDSICSYLFDAVTNKNGTGIRLLSDIFGFEDSATCDFAYHVTCNGYNVLVPDLFRGNPWRKSLPTDGFEQWLSRHTPGCVSGDACMRWLVDEFMAVGDSKKLGVIRIMRYFLFVCGDGDVLCIIEMVQELERRAKGAKAVVYAGMGHEFGVT
ncbi:hypothetical protein PR202_ga24561 [Eleusine coracana subsp. coracana]|uniref:Uncharacterized protein n=1 Tax=Eleusine coracana subsp. coracana TaxID=191504 RepID=A0AAV5D926_ELECO|nr:hypothetical protein PR202_ga24561 [Eleusine coracana subsp. coracana]